MNNYDKEVQAQWRLQAQNAIRQGQTETEFVSHCHVDNRIVALRAYRWAAKGIVSAR